MKRDYLGNKLLKKVAKTARKEAVKNANTACWVYNHQDKLPEKVKDLRKF
ncbi:AgrD family cyclic lactone autoinducer peptide [Eubacterium callanderi]|uniref:Cyclic lactone autoinducer peptide n=1 Tax=Eubacterium callanderi TaxID=53442 RepID=A0A853JNE4_9FIRM|nr:cyclic lactone autoinducer peptide [Eubacterium callanderi]